MKGGGASAQRRWLEPWAPLGKAAGPGERLFQGLEQARSEGEARPTGARRRCSQEGSAVGCTEPRGIKDKGPETTGGGHHICRALCQRPHPPARTPIWRSLARGQSGRITNVKKC